MANKEIKKDYNDILKSLMEDEDIKACDYTTIQVLKVIKDLLDNGVEIDENFNVYVKIILCKPDKTKEEDIIRCIKEEIEKGKEKRIK